MLILKMELDLYEICGPLAFVVILQLWLFFFSFFLMFTVKKEFL